MNKLLTLLAFLPFAMNACATDIINLYDRALKHNIDLSHKKIDLNIANEVLKQTQSSTLQKLIFLHERVKLL
jgi:hypothetical protein